MKIAYVYDTYCKEAFEACSVLSKLYGKVSRAKADFLVVCGGDGTFLDAAQIAMRFEIPCYGVNYGTYGFLLNERPATPALLASEIETASETVLHPFSVTASGAKGESRSALVVNNVLMAHSDPTLAVDLNLALDGTAFREGVRADGLLVGTEMSALSYFSSAGGIAPKMYRKNAALLAPICAMPIFSSYFAPFAGRFSQALVTANQTDYRKTTVSTDRGTLLRDATAMEVVRRVDISFRFLHKAALPFAEKYAREAALVAKRRREAKTNAPSSLSL